MYIYYDKFDQGLWYSLFKLRGKILRVIGNVLM